MIIVEFVIFVVSSGLFFSEKFRHNLWAVIIAGVIATGSSLLFMYHLGIKMTGHEQKPVVVTKIVKQPVVKTVLPSQPAAASTARPHTCTDEYPAEALAKSEEGTTRLRFKILTDGTVSAIKVAASSGSVLLDEAAVKCVANWHYQPAIKDGKLAETYSGAKVAWVLPVPAEVAPEPQPKADTEKTDVKANKKAEQTATPSDTAGENRKSRHWYNPLSWFSSSEPEKKSETQQSPQP